MPESEMTGNILFFTSRRTENAAAPEKVQAEAAKQARLIEQVCERGDRDAFDELYKIFAPMVHGIVLARVPRDAVDDIVQEVFLAAYEKLPSLRERNAFGGWLAAIARNSATEFYRTAKQTEELPENLSRCDAPHREAREILDAIRQLPDSYSETLVLRLVEGMTGAEIAEQTGLTPESVRVNLHRGMKLLRERLGVEGAIKQ
jgi:RNA polymerase sigma-70 factor, ECF subfamily